LVNNKTRPYILVTNDDGISAPGIHALIMELKKVADIIVVAPSTEKSAVGHAITLSDPLRVDNFEKGDDWKGFSVSGTPADCVKIAVCSLLDKKPDLVLSGINLGANTGINVIYSGTVSAATEGAILGIPSIAVSLTTYINPIFEPAAKYAAKMALHLFETGLAEKTLLNINVPNITENEIKGVKVTKQGMARFAEKFEKRIDLKNRVYYWLGGSKADLDEPDDVDDKVVENNYISITPIQYDMTNYEVLEELKERIPDLDE